MQGIQALPLASASQAPRTANASVSAIAQKITSIGLGDFDLRRPPTQPRAFDDNPVPLVAPVPYQPMHFAPSVIFGGYLKASEFNGRRCGVGRGDVGRGRSVSYDNPSQPSSPVDEDDDVLSLNYDVQADEDERMTLPVRNERTGDGPGWRDSTWQTFDVAGSEYAGQEPMYERAGAWLFDADVQTTQAFRLR